MADVALLKCRGYDPQEIKDHIVRGLEIINFPLERFNGARVVLKPNLLSASRPDSAVVTHPQFFRAAAELVIDHGARPMLAESPAVSSLRSAIRAAGYDPVLKHLGIPVADMIEVERLPCPQRRKTKLFEVGRAFFEAELIVNLPKFKTHGLTYVSGAVKNLFGAMPGMRKSQMHLKFPEGEDFSEFLLDLYSAFLEGFDPPRTLIHIMDGILAMEGNGPGSTGTPRPMHAIVMGEDALAVDWVAVEVSGLDALRCPTLVQGFRRGLGISSPGEIAVKGERIEDMRVHGFVPPDRVGPTRLLRAPAVRRLVRDLFAGRPAPVDTRCTLCYQCRDICPAGAIGEAEEGKKVPRFDYGACIRCLCCQEICPQGAISLKKGRLQWMIR
ncbi:MAG: DUF362 domain-containing protein [Desulfomonilia bacterium]|jgi:uncharacterized protein (DUF362 family)/Pyruvate/2-oxoacid:ferredoxin oxidoreductase delta subunit